MISHSFSGLLIAAFAAGIAPGRADEKGLGITHYFDEDTYRHLMIDRSEDPTVMVEIRFAADPGYSHRWQGKGTSENREIRFTRILGEEEEKGAEFTASVSASRAQIDFSPEQIEPGDEGLNGEYRRISDEKRLSLVKRELKSAEESLSIALRKLGGPKEPGLDEWKRRWIELRTRVAALRALPDGAKHEDLPEYWITLIEITGAARSYAEQPFPEVAIPENGAGNYDDGFGGGVALRARDDGSYRLSFSWQRGELEAMGSDLSVEIPATKVEKSADGSWSATFTHDDPGAGAAPGDERPLFRVRKAGRFLIIDVEHAGRHTGKAWIDGVYRWGPIPLEG